MPITLKNIDKIGREKDRDVLYIEFDKRIFSDYEYEKYGNRANLIKFLEDNNIEYESCFGYTSQYGFEKYREQLYIDIPFDEALVKYNLINDYIEDESGKRRFDGIGLFVLLLEDAKQNAFMDASDYEAIWAQA